MKYELFSIGRLTIHGYGVMIGLGFICAVALGMFRAKRNGLSTDDVAGIAIWAVVAGFIGAKLLFVLVEFKAFLAAPLSVLGSTGFVAYGGILAGAAAAWLYSKKHRQNFLGWFDLLAPSLALAQGFGRLGCFMAGCCYGAVTNSVLGIVFPEGGMAPAGVRLWPTQLFSAGGDFVIAAILLATYHKLPHKGDGGALYLLLYAVGRFIVEFFRSDERGAVGVLSTSQFISIFIFAAAVGLLLYNRRKKPKTKE
jgi:prolipoprotein diacylglyceryl transferase